MNPFSHKTSLQRTTLRTFTGSQKYRNGLKLKEQLLNKVENSVAKLEIVHYYMSLLILSQCFQKVVCCSGVKRHGYFENG